MVAKSPNEVDLQKEEISENEDAETMNAVDQENVDKTINEEEEYELLKPDDGHTLQMHVDQEDDELEHEVDNEEQVDESDDDQGCMDNNGEKNLEKENESTGSKSPKASNQDEEKEKSSKNKLWVSRLHPRTTRDDIMTVFSKYGTVIDCTIVKSSHTPTKKFALVTMSTAAEVDKAITYLNETEFIERIIFVEKTEKSLPKQFNYFDDKEEIPKASNSEADEEMLETDTSKTYHSRNQSRPYKRGRPYFSYRGPPYNAELELRKEEVRLEREKLAYKLELLKREERQMTMNQEPGVSKRPFVPQEDRPFWKPHKYYKEPGFYPHPSRNSRFHHERPHFNRNFNTGGFRREIKPYDDDRRIAEKQQRMASTRVVREARPKPMHRADYEEEPQTFWEHQTRPKRSHQDEDWSSRPYQPKWYHKYPRGAGRGNAGGTSDTSQWYGSSRGGRY